MKVDAGPSSFGIYAYYSQNITIFGCRVYSSGTGVSIYYTSYCQIYENIIERSGIGISITGSEVESTGHHNLIRNNTVTSNSNYGIYLGGYRNSVYQNNVTGNDRGINVGSDFSNVCENIVTRNKYQMEKESPWARGLMDATFPIIMLQKTVGASYLEEDSDTAAATYPTP